MSRKLRADDTSPWPFGFGSGKDGVYTPSSGAFSTNYYSCSGTVGTYTLTCTNSFTAGDFIVIQQARGTGVGEYEFNAVVSRTPTEVTLALPLQNTYTDSGSSQAQAVKFPQYSAVDIDTGFTITTSGFGGNAGGVTGWFCPSTTVIDGTLSATGAGFVGGSPAASSGNPSPQDAAQGEGTAGAGIATNGSGTFTNAANGNGGGGGRTSGTCPTAGGGGGGNGTAGSNGTLDATGSAGNVGTGGSAVGNAGLTLLNFGGGGGAPLIGNLEAGGSGGNGGGIVLIITNQITVAGSIVTGGNNGVASTGAGRGSGGGGGGGGSVLIKANTATLGTNKITAPAGSGANGGESAGGNGGVGRIHLDYATSYTGTTTPTINATKQPLWINNGPVLFF